jgi:general secretion pathway protein H
LIEVMVVVVLIGIMATFAVLSIGGRGADDVADAEARRCLTVLQLASDEAGLKSVEIGFRTTQTGYEFVARDDHQRWVDYTGDVPLAPHAWPASLTSEMRVDGHLIPPGTVLPLQLAQPSKPASESADKTEDEAGDTPESGGGVVVSGGGDKDDKEDSEKTRRKPQVMLLSSGEVTPFTLDLRMTGLKGYFHVEGTADGKLTLERRADGAPRSGKSA